MKPTMLDLPEESRLALEQLAHQTGRSEAELIQEAVQDYLNRHKKLPRSVAMGASGRHDLSEKDELLLWQDA